MSLVGITRVGIIRTGITRMLDQQGRYRQWPASCGHQARGPVTVLPLTPPSSSGVWANHSPSPHPTNLGIRRVGLSQCHLLTPPSCGHNGYSPTSPLACLSSPTSAIILLVALTGC